jgi:hypothetical protein
MKMLVLIAALTVWPSGAATVFAADDLARAKELYEAAAYEDALAALDGVVGTTPADRVNIEQYRALCLIALGRLPEAERAIVALVGADPTYIPSASVASPRVLSLISDVRKRELPAIVRRTMDDGREAFQRKELSAAREHFDLVMTLIDDPVMAEREEVEDLRVLARGFTDLAAATTAAPEAGNAPAAPGEERKAPALSASSSSPSPAPTTPVIVPAIAIQQVMPRWEPPAAFATIEYKGSIRIIVGIDGKVKSAVVEQRSHPAYDARLLAATADWLYKPATRNGEPIESERVIPVHLLPPRDN